MKKYLKERAKKIAQQQGFSSVQEAVRFFLTQLVHQKIQISVVQRSIKLSEESVMRYDLMIDDIEKGGLKIKTYNTVDDLVEELEK